MCSYFLRTIFILLSLPSDNLFIWKHGIRRRKNDSFWRNSQRFLKHLSKSPAKIVVHRTKEIALLPTKLVWKPDFRFQEGGKEKKTRRRSLFTSKFTPFQLICRLFCSILKCFLALSLAPSIYVSGPRILLHIRRWIFMTLRQPSSQPQFCIL